MYKHQHEAEEVAQRKANNLRINYVVFYDGEEYFDEKESVQ